MWSKGSTVGKWALARWEVGREKPLPTTGWPRPTPTSNVGVIGHTHATDAVVGHRSHLARTPCAMPARTKSTALMVDRAWHVQPEKSQRPLHP